MKRRTFIEKSALASGMLLTFPTLISCNADIMTELPVTDLHVHTTGQFTIEKILDIGKKQQVNFGVVDHPAPWALRNDKDLENYINTMRNYPVYVGLQPTYLGWSKNYSQELIAQLDYILMDPQMVPQGNGKTWQIWEFDTYIDDTEDFMNRYMDYAMQVLTNESIDIFAWPLFLPVCIARDYYSLWTEERMQKIIAVAKDRNIAIEINDMAHTPHKEFIMKAKTHGLKFTFGSDCRNNNAGRLAYCRHIAKECNLQPDDFWLPGKKG